MSENFWGLIEQYRTLGFDPLRWVSGCSNEIDPRVLSDSIERVKKAAVKISPSWFDSYYYMDGKTPDLTRRIYSFDRPTVDKEVDIRRALAIMRIHARTSEDEQALTEAFQNFLTGFHSKVSISMAAVVLTEHADGQFAVFDYIGIHRGDKVGYTPATSTVTHITDVTRPPDAEIHSNIAMTSAIDTLNLLGCYNSSSFKLFPVYDAPSEETLDRIRANLDSFTSRYNLAMEDYSSLKIGKLFYGCSGIANTLKELPTGYEHMEEGMQIILTKKFGSLVPLSLYMLAMMDQGNISKYEQNGISFNDITAAKDEALKSLSEPHFSLGKIISKYCPDFGSVFDKNMHIAAVHPVTTRGILALGDFARVANSHIQVAELPIKYEELSKFATREFLVENATCSANGCHMIVATQDVAQAVSEELQKHNFDPVLIGQIAGRGRPAVTIDRDAGQYVASKVKLAGLTAVAADSGPKGVADKKAAEGN